MKTKHFLVIGVILLATLGLAIQDFEQTQSTLYINASLITLEDSHPVATTMLVEDGKIKAFDSKPSSILDNNTIIVDLNGATVLPGFIDSHTHVALAAFLESMIDLSGFTHSSNDQVWAHLKTAVSQIETGEWIIGKGLDPVLVKDLVTPNMQFLDEIAPENPVFLMSQSLHTFWANSKAFELAGIGKDTPDPSEASYYERNAEGKLTGAIFEQAAFQPFGDILAKTALSQKVLMQNTTKVLKDYARHGNTSIVSAGLTIKNEKPLMLYQHLSDREPKILYQLLSAVGLLPAREPYPRHFAYVRHDTDFLLPKSKIENDFYNILGIKHWYDGSPYTGSMFLDEPYLQSDLTKNRLHIPDGTRGAALVEKNDLIKFIRDYHSKGWQIAIHSQGDISTREVLDAYEEVNKTMDTNAGRHRIEHALLIEKKDIERMQALNMSPSFHIDHLYYYGVALNDSIIGSVRAETMFPVAFTSNLNMKYSFHADKPMFNSSPLALIHTAVKRHTKEGNSIGTDEAITVMDGIKAQTIHAAWQINMETKLGSLKVGKYADFIVLDKNPLKVELEELKSIKVLQTYVNGNRVKFN